MTAAKQRYARLVIGLAESLIKAGISLPAVLTLLRLLLHPMRRSIPGLIPLGEAGAAEALNLEVSTFRKHARELESAGAILFDRSERLLFVIGSVAADSPRTDNAVRSMGREYRELPQTSPVTLAVRHELDEALNESDYEKLRDLWLKERIAPSPRPKKDALLTRQSAADSRADSGSVPSPIPLTETIDPATATLYHRAWSRLRRPFAAAADDDILKAVTTFDLPQFDQLVQELATSGWPAEGSRLHTPPTLSRLVNDLDYAERIMLGGFAAKPYRRWSCPDCKVPHPPSDTCPPPCRACREAHAKGFTCNRLAALEDRERMEAECRQTPPRSLRSIGVVK